MKTLLHGAEIRYFLASKVICGWMPATTERRRGQRLGEEEFDSQRSLRLLVNLLSTSSKASG